MQNNINQFNEVAATIFAYLHDHFPKPVGMKMHELVGGEINSDEMSMCPKTDFAKDVVNWLTDEGYIKSSGGNFALYSQCVLTSKGLDALNSTPDSLGGKATTISKIKDGLATGSSEVIKAAIGATVKSIVSHAL
ncbi:hypothetical protein [Psychromonas aquimarina]|uniref:hypothetical protein n=1 Tax=Psychromonas aquimarina TaxID=444919 RepID=UPI0004914A1C|nr:hypothetical protein [Psychromonas aquimarina]